MNDWVKILFSLRANSPHSPKKLLSYPAMPDFAINKVTELEKGLKNSKVIRFENSGHGLFVEEQEKFNTELEEFAKQ